MELGGNSIAAVSASVAMEREGFHVTVGQLLDNFTLKEIIQAAINNRGIVLNVSAPVCQIDKGEHFMTLCDSKFLSYTIP